MIMNDATGVDFITKINGITKFLINANLYETKESKIPKTTPKINPETTRKSVEKMILKKLFDLTISRSALNVLGTDGRK
jgi:hypothetical protein